MNSTTKKTHILQLRDGAKLYLEERGSGEPVIFVYGIACLINHWNRQIPFFAKRNQTITFDLRGHHKSERGALERLTIQDLATDLIEIIDHFDLPSAHLVGHSFGAPVLIDAARQFPEKIRSLTFINGFARNPVQGMFGVDVVEPFFHLARKSIGIYPSLWQFLWKKLVDQQLSGVLAGLAGGFNLNLTQFKDIEIYGRGVASMELENFVRLFQSMIDYDGRAYLAKIAAPTLIISGESDGITPRHFQEELRAGIPHARYEQIKEGSHCCQLDFPELVNLLIAQHINDEQPL